MRRVFCKFLVAAKAGDMSKSPAVPWPCRPITPKWITEARLKIYTFIYRLYGVVFNVRGCRPRAVQVHRVPEGNPAGLCFTTR